MSKTKAIVSALTVMAAAGAVVTRMLVKKRARIKVEGEIQTKPNGRAGSKSGRTVRGEATVGGTSGTKST